MISSLIEKQISCCICSNEISN